jgi:hypothetical protein
MTQTQTSTMTISYEVNEGGSLSFHNANKFSQVMNIINKAITGNRPVELIKWTAIGGNDPTEELLLSHGYGEDYTSPEITPKPKCIRHKKIDAVWFFPYKQFDKDMKGYYCEECAHDYNYTVFKQPLQRIEEK